MKQINVFGVEEADSNLLKDRFLEPPFSVLDRKSGRWQNRARQWKKLGIKSELGRLGDLTFNMQSFDYDDEKIRKQAEIAAKKGECLPEFDEKYGRKNQQGTSIFDPVLCEIMYKWFAPDGGTILDPFAGGSVRGIVAGYLRYKYTGFELSQKQVLNNVEQAVEILGANNNVNWIIGDSNKNLDLVTSKFDLIFSCPPYMDLEVYSDDAADLSNKSDDEFYHLYDSIIAKACDKLKRHSYAAWVVGDVRDKYGYYKDFLSGTKQAFKKCGMKLYNEIVLLDPLGTAPVRANTVFASRKVVKVHQNVYIFYKP